MKAVWSGMRTICVAVGCAFSSVGCAVAQTGTDIPIIVMADDGDPISLASSNSASQYIATKIKEQFHRYNYYVVDQNAVAASLGFDFSRRMTSANVLSAAMQAKRSGKSQFDVRGVVIYKVFARVKDLGFAKQFSLEVAGEVQDADAERYLGDFGPVTRTFPAPADCSDNACISSVLREKGVDIAAIVADEGRKKLAMLTKVGASTGGAIPGNTPASAGGSLVTTYNFRFENFQMGEVLKIKGVMESEFPDFVRPGRVSGSDPILQYGYVSKAPQDKIFEWTNILIKDLGLKNAKILIDGNNITVKNMASDLPPSSSSGQRGKFR